MASTPLPTITTPAPTPLPTITTPAPTRAPAVCTLSTLQQEGVDFRIARFSLVANTGWGIYVDTTSTAYPVSCNKNASSKNYVAMSSFTVTKLLNCTADVPTISGLSFGSSFPVAITLYNSLPYLGVNTANNANSVVMMQTPWKWTLSFQSGSNNALVTLSTVLSGGTQMVLVGNFTQNADVLSLVPTSNSQSSSSSAQWFVASSTYSSAGWGTTYTASSFLSAS